MVIVDSTVNFRRSDVAPEFLEELKRTHTVSLPWEKGKFEMFEYDEETQTFRFPRIAHRFFVNREHKVDVIRGDRRIPREAPKFSPRDGQDEAIKVMTKFLSDGVVEKGFSGGILSAGCGKGKALLSSEPVLTEDGWIPIKNIQVGDRVAGTDGMFHPVTGVYPQEGIRDIYEVRFTDGSSVRCDRGHLWTFVKRRNSSGPIEVTVTVEELLSESLRGKSGRKFFLPEVEPVEFPKLEHRIDPYTLGVLLGDGGLSIRGRVTLTTADTEIIDELRMPNGYRAAPLRQSNAGKAQTYLLSRPLDEWNKDHSQGSLHGYLDQMGLIGKTSHTKFIPLEYMFSSVEDRLSILQGLFDTDGTPTVSAVVEYCTVSRRLLDGVKELAQSLGGTCISGESSVALPDGRLTTYYRARVKLPRRFKAFRLQRKQEKMDAVKRQREPYRAVDSVVRAKVGETVCISVESEDRLYLTSGYIPTHNTVMASKILLNLGVPTCILVHKEFLEKQWMEALRETLGSKATVGVFRRNKKDNGSTHDVVVASTQTITSKKRVIPEEFLNSFGLLVLDEVHRYGAEVWQTAIWKYPAAMRLGLTATPDRMDGMWPVIYSNIGPVAYELESEAIDNSVYIVKLRTPVNTAEWGAEWMDKMQRRAKMLSVLASHEGRNKAISGQIEKAYKKGRRILVISERINQLEVLRDMLVYAGGNPEHTGLLIGGTKKADREAIQEKQVIFSTYGMSKEGLDIPSLDTLFLASPQADIRQTVGRILRDLVGKCHPITVDFVDTSIEELVGQAFHRLRDYQAMGCHVHGDVQ
jgi:superfamily II DNA or RNA helicase